MTQGTRTVSEREAVLRERDAFRACFCYLTQREYFTHPPRSSENIGTEIEHRIAERFPLPKRVVPRVVAESTGIEYTTVRRGEGADQCLAIVMRYRADEPWMSCFPTSMAVTLDRAQLWADLLANPTEEIPDAGEDPTRGD